MLWLNCSALHFDGGDCLQLDADGCPPGSILAPCPVAEGRGGGGGAAAPCVLAEWVGDGDCDAELEDGWGLNCSATGYDGGDCLGTPTRPAPTSSLVASLTRQVRGAGGERACAGGHEPGCDGGCVPSALLGDGFCDDCTVAMATEGYCEEQEVRPTPRFNCSRLAYDGGDCLRDGAGCYGGHALDCRQRCAPTDWLGDGVCDDEFDGFHLNCSATAWDGGDCRPG